MSRKLRYYFGVFISLVIAFCTAYGYWTFNNPQHIVFQVIIGAFALLFGVLSFFGMTEFYGLDSKSEEDEGEWFEATLKKLVFR